MTNRQAVASCMPLPDLTPSHHMQAEHKNPLPRRICKCGTRFIRLTLLQVLHPLQLGQRHGLHGGRWVREAVQNCKGKCQPYATLGVTPRVAPFITPYETPYATPGGTLLALNPPPFCLCSPSS